MKKTLFLIPFLAILFVPVFAHADAVFPDGCTATTKYSATTGQPCQKPACSPGDVYNYNTGQKCADISANLPEGCVSTEGFSPLTGHKCDGSVPATSSIVQTQSLVTGTPQQVTPSQTDSVTASIEKLKLYPVFDQKVQEYTLKIKVYDPNNMLSQSDLIYIHSLPGRCSCGSSIYVRNSVHDFNNNTYEFSMVFYDTYHVQSVQNQGIFGDDGTFTVDIPKMGILQSFSKSSFGMGDFVHINS